MTLHTRVKLKNGNVPSKYTWTKQPSELKSNILSANNKPMSFLPSTRPWKKYYNMTFPAVTVLLLCDTLKQHAGTTIVLNLRDTLATLIMVYRLFRIIKYLRLFCRRTYEVGPRNKYSTREQVVGAKT